MSACRLSISIVTYNHANSIRETLDSIFLHTKDVDFQLTVIDNGSRDDTCKIVRQYESGLKLIENRHNKGFGAAHNQAIMAADSKYHAIINPDVTLTDNVLKKMCDYLDIQTDVGLLTPKVLFPGGQLQILPKRDPRYIYLAARRLPLRCFEKYRKIYEMAEYDPDTSFDIEFTTGCFMFARMDILKSIKGFDERFFLYFEDADLGRRIRQVARTEYNPDFVIYHAWERGGSKDLKLLLIQILSMHKYMWKWRGGRSL